MRHCEECKYLSFYGEEDPESYCPLVSEDDPKFDEDVKGCGCHYNIRTLQKRDEEREEAEYRDMLGYDDFLLVNGIDLTEENSRKLKMITEVMMHTIGMWPEGLRHAYKRHGKIFYRPYRNYFSTAPHLSGYWMWERMEKAGHAERIKVDPDSGGEIWHLTRRGLNWLEMKLKARIYDEED